MAKQLWHAALACLMVVCAAPGASVLDASDDVSRRHVGRGTVAAGRAHSVIATPEGRVSAWGAGRRGQIGDGALLDRPLPTPLPDLDGIVQVSAGAAHTLAVTEHGDVYAWGANGFGRLGDGTTRRRSAPVRVRGIANVAMVAAGRGHSLALTGDGRVFAWGHNNDGQLGVGNRMTSVVPIRVRDLPAVVAIAAGEAHSLAITRGGRVYAWGSNQFATLGDGTTKDRLRPVALGLVDVIAVAGGSAHSLALLRDGSVWSWGRGAFGELGTGSTRIATRPALIQGLKASAIAAGRHFSAAIRADGNVVTWGANESGQLGDGTTLRRLRPVVVQGVAAVESIALGAAHAIAVTASGDVRTWGDGDAGQLGDGALVDRAGAVEILSDIPDWGVAPGDNQEPPDTTPPSITAITSPPLVDGWMTVPVIVTFQCADDVGVASCSAPVTVAVDGYAQRVTGIATDTAGNQSTVTTLVNVDLNPPALAITTPQDRSTTDADVVDVTGEAIDLASGLADGRCNGEPAEVVDGLVRCSVRLHPGRNEIILHASDVAGHNSSAAVSVTRVGTPSMLMLSPATRAMVVSEEATLSLRDDFGSTVGEATWSTSDNTIVALSETDPPVLTAVGVGSATITAEKDGLTATALIDVSVALAAGATRWSVAPLTGRTSGTPLFANRVDADSPALFTVDFDRDDRATVRGVTADGEVLWQQHALAVPWMGDAFGGVLAGAYDANFDFRAYLRFGGGSIQPWRYESRGRLERPAQAPDGILYAIERLPGGVNIDGEMIWDKYAIVLDGSRGRLINRTLLRRDVDEFIADLNGQVLDMVPPVRCRSLFYDFAPETVGPVVGTDGRGYLIVRHHEIRKRADCIEPFQRRADRTIRMGLDLVILSPDAAPRTINLYSTACDGALGSTLPCDLPVSAHQIIPDGIGGTLVTWERGTGMVGQSVFVQRSMTRVNAAGELNERLVAPQFWLELMGQGGAALTYDDGWRAIDVVSGETRWANLLPNLAVLAARPDGGLATLDVTTGELKTTDASGEVESAQPFNLDWRAVQRDGDWIGLRDGALTAVVGDFSDATRWSAMRGNPQGQLSVRRPGTGIFGKTHLAFGTPLDMARFRHVSIRVVPHDQAKWAAVPGLTLAGSDEFGNRFFTIGAGSDSTDTNATCGGTLKSALNRTNDVGTPPWDPLEQLPYPPGIEDAMIRSLLDRNAAYPNDLPYACRPEQNPGFYNSNSFAHGLLIAAGLPAPRLPSRIPSLVPGWLRPVPRAKFQ